MQASVANASTQGQRSRARARGSDERAGRGRRGKQRRVPVGSEREREPCRPCSPRRQAGEAQPPIGRGEQQREPEAADRAGDLREFGRSDTHRAGSRTNTAARAV